MLRRMRVVIEPEPYYDEEGEVPPVRLAGSRVLVPFAMSATIRYEHDDQPGAAPIVTIDLAIEVVQGVPVCTRLAIAASPDRPITRATIEHIDPDALVRQVMELSVMGPGLLGPPAEEVAAALDELPTIQRKQVTSARLAEVAAAYRRGGAQAIARELRVSQPHAYRLARQAREAGILKEGGR
jgi:hypothetical protein